MATCFKCQGDISGWNAVRRMVANEVVYYHRWCAPPEPEVAVVEKPKPKQEKAVAKAVVVPHDIAISTAKGAKGWKSRVRLKYGPEVLAAAIGRH